MIIIKNLFQKSLIGEKITKKIIKKKISKNADGDGKEKENQMIQYNKTL